METAFNLAFAARSDPWALTPVAHATMLNMADAVSMHGMPSVVAAAVPRRAPAATEGGQALISITGIIEARPGWLTGLGMGTACSDVEHALRAAVDDPRVQRIVLAVDSPGGSVYGLAELADAIYAARSKKPVLAVVEGQAGSAGYWIASQAAKVFASQSSEVGSIGCYVAHVDQSRALDRQGLTVSLIHAGKYKVEGQPFEPLGDEARAFMQQRVDDHMSAFTGHVARGRGVPPSKVRSGFGQGRMLGATDALCAGMIDGVCGLREVMTGKAGVKGSATARGSQWRAIQAAIADVSLPAATRAARLLQLQADIARLS